MNPGDLGRLARTVRHLPPRQVVHRIRLRAQKQAYRVAPKAAASVFTTTVGEVRGWPSGFRPVDASTVADGRPSLAQNLRGHFELLDVALDLGRPIEWQPTQASQLWRYHLHYFDWAWVLTQDAGPANVAAFAELYRSWRAASPVGRWDAWSPYVVALRAWTLCSVAASLAADRQLTAELHDDLATHARYLRANVEFDVGGNHLLKDLKALVALAVFLGDERLLRFAGRHLHWQLAIQVLPDGGHFERSPGYHAQVLGDLIDVQRLLAAAGAMSGLVASIADAVGRMRRWLSELVQPDGTVPQLNDSVPVSPAQLAVLGIPPVPGGALSLLEPSGYVVARPRDGVSVTMDAGPPCPDELPAHAQADALALLVQVDGADVLVDTGTSTYAPGDRRQYERSTRAHNTIEVDGEDQTEVWGAFRAGRRHRVTVHQAGVDADGGGIVIDASHDGYRHLPGSPVHRRSVCVTGDRVEILDNVIGDGSHDLALYWHLGPAATWDEADAAAEVAGARLSVVAPGDASCEFVEGGAEPLGVVASAHNVVYDAPCLVVRVRSASLPVVFRTTIEFGAVRDDG